MLKNAHARGVEQIICIGTNEKDSEAALAFAENHPNVFCSWGIHPEYAGATSCSGFSPNTQTPAVRNTTITKRVRGDVVDERRTDCCISDDCESRTRTKPEREVTLSLVCIGEIGLDYHYGTENRKAQIALLEQMLDLACAKNLPCSFHVRDAFDDFFAVAKNFSGLRPSVLHSFTDSKENLKKALNAGFHIGINGILVNHSAEFSWANDLGDNLPLDRFVLETDAPFLTPAPNRGKINEPGNVADVASWLANKLGVSEQVIAEQTTKNARKIFNLPDPEPTESRPCA